MGYRRSSSYTTGSLGSQTLNSYRRSSTDTDNHRRSSCDTDNYASTAAHNTGSLLQDQCPISGSLIDLMTLIQCLTRFTHVMSDVIFPLCTSTSQADRRVSFRNCCGNQNGKQNKIPKQHQCNTLLQLKHYAAARTKLLQKLKYTIKNAMHLYNCNILALDICGLSDNTAVRLMGHGPVKDTKDAHKHGSIWGCRHVNETKTSCFHYWNKKVKYLGDRFEPVSKQMCLRINNISSLADSVPIVMRNVCARLQEEHLVKLACMPADAAQPCLQQPSLDIRHTDKNPDQHTAPCSTSGHANQIVSQSMDGLLHVLAYRLSLFCKEALVILMGLNTHRTDVTTRFYPLQDFLRINLKLIRDILYSSLFHKMVTYLWVIIAKHLEKMAWELHLQSEISDYQIKSHLQVVALLLKFFKQEDPVASIDTLSEYTEKTCFWLQLHTQSTAHLITLFKQLLSWQQFKLSDSGIEMDTRLPSKQQIQHMRDELHADNKCFSGMQIIRWIMSNWAVLKPLDSDFPIGSTEADETDALQYADNMFCHGIIAAVHDDVTARLAHDTDVTDSLYPQTDGGALLRTSRVSNPALVTYSFEESSDDSSHQEDSNVIVEASSATTSTEYEVVSLSGSYRATKHEDRNISPEDCYDRHSSDGLQQSNASSNLPVSNVTRTTLGAQFTESTSAKLGGAIQEMPVSPHITVPRSNALQIGEQHACRESVDSQSTTTTIYNTLFHSSNRRFYYFPSVVEDLSLDDYSYPDAARFGSRSTSRPSLPSSPAKCPVCDSEHDDVTRCSHSERCRRMTLEQIDDVSRGRQLNERSIMDRYLSRGVDADFILAILSARRSRDAGADDFLTQKDSLEYPEDYINYL